MGIIRAAVDTARGTLADQWLDVVKPVKWESRRFLPRASS